MLVQITICIVDGKDTWILIRTFTEGYEFGMNRM